MDVQMIASSNHLNLIFGINEIFFLDGTNNQSSTIEPIFISNIRKLIEANLEDENFDILLLCKKVGISRSQLHNKIKSFTGVSTSIYIRSVRLKKAKHLIERTDLNISQVAYKVGFKDASYFSRNFKEKYGIVPSKIIRNN